MSVRYSVITGRTLIVPRLPTTPRLRETVYLDTYKGSVDAATPLAAGTRYSVTVTGTVTDWNAALPLGHAEPDAMFPTAHEKRSSTQVGIDAATIFALPTGSTRPLGAWAQLQVNLHDGRNWQAMVPLGGPFQTPQPGHTYRYTLTGKGQPASFRWHDIDLLDNYGALRIDLSDEQGS